MGGVERGVSPVELSPFFARLLEVACEEVAWGVGDGYVYMSVGDAASHTSAGQAWKTYYSKEKSHCVSYYCKYVKGSYLHQLYGPFSQPLYRIRVRILASIRGIHGLEDIHHLLVRGGPYTRRTPFTRHTNCTSYNPYTLRVEHLMRWNYGVLWERVTQLMD